MLALSHARDRFPFVLFCSCTLIVRTLRSLNSSLIFRSLRSASSEYLYACCRVFFCFFFHSHAARAISFNVENSFMVDSGLNFGSYYNDMIILWSTLTHIVFVFKFRFCNFSVKTISEPLRERGPANCLFRIRFQIPIRVHLMQSKTKNRSFYHFQDSI